jgi:hypothetical protein
LAIPNVLEQIAEGKTPGIFLLVNIKQTET